MNNEKRIAIIIEGEKYEKKIVNSIRKHFFTRDNKTLYTIIPLPMASNIYVLWRELNDDDYLDIIELVRERTPQAQKALEGLDRESFSEVYLFFDYDSHQNNIKSNENADEILLEMLDTFDNETENGKLYISYPMAEAIRDSILGDCHTYSGNCYYEQVDREYKSLSGKGNSLSHIGSYTKNKWADFINVYRGRIACLFKSESLVNIRFCKDVSTTQLHLMQMNNKYDTGSGIIVLSAFPKFLIDYFKEDYLEDMVIQRDYIFPYCNGTEKEGNN